MNELFSYLLVFAFILLLTREWVLQVKYNCQSKNQTFFTPQRLLIFALLSVIISYSLNILCSLNLMSSPYLTNETTSFATFLSFTIYLVIKLKSSKRTPASVNLRKYNKKGY